MVVETTNALIELARNDEATEAELDSAMESFFTALSKATPADANAALGRLCEQLDPPVPHAGALALICGALVENGCDPRPLARPLISRLETLLRSSAELTEACLARLPAPVAESDNKDGTGEDDPPVQFETILAETAVTMPQQHEDWIALQQFWLPGVALFSVSREARTAARYLGDLAVRIRDYHAGGYWLSLMLAVLDDEPIVVIEPQTKKGILARISGVVDNFQLNTLLMDGFPTTGIFARRRVPRRVAEVAQGKGPQQSEEIVTAVWNLYTWEAIEPGLKLPEASNYNSSEYWIWNEGTPADIPILDGRRVILLGPASYPRGWQSQRMFDSLPAALTVEQKLSPGQVQEWLTKMVAAKGAKG